MKRYGCSGGLEKGIAEEEPPGSEAGLFQLRTCVCLLRAFSRSHCRLRGPRVHLSHSQSCHLDYALDFRPHGYGHVVIGAYNSSSFISNLPRLDFRFC